MQSIAAMLLVFAAGTLPAVALTHSHPLPVFIDRASGSGVIWTAADGGKAQGVDRADGREPGVRLPCRLSQVRERVAWDCVRPLDLGPATGISLRVRVGNPNAIRSITFYLRSGNGWFAVSTTDFGTEWSTLRWDRTQFGQEGEPDGWHSISALRVAVWRGNGEDTVVELADLRQHRHRILIVRNDHHAATVARDAWTVNHYADLAASWLAAAGVPSSIVSDSRLGADFPAAARVAILPFNPNVAASEAALLSLLRRGGSLVICYHLPDALAPLIGVRPGRWMEASAPDSFAAIRFATRPERGYPEQIRQDSWNALIPTPVNAQVLGTWHDGRGRDSGLPAVTLGDRGAFIGHVLTNSDRENKARFLIALIADLQPGLRRSLLDSMLGQADRFLHLEDRQEQRHFLLNEARRNATTEVTRAQLLDIDRYRGRTVELFDTASLGTLFDRIAVLRRMVSVAYLGTQPPFARADEWRGMWAHEPDGLPGLDWETIVARIAGYGVTALLPNLLWPGRAFYPTDVFGGGASGEPDRLTEVLAATGRHGLELHLWKVCWNLQRAPADWIAAIRAGGRLQVSATGEPVNWLCPSHPGNRQIEKDAIVDAARRYPVDGIHLDYIRYPGAQACYCAGCRERFGKAAGIAIRDWPTEVRAGGPHTAAWQDWRRRQITSWLESVRAALRSERPDLKLSAAVFPDIRQVRDTIAQDWPRWIENGLLDFVIPMNYTDGDAAFQRYLDAQLPLATARIPVYPGIGVSAPGLSVAQTARQLDLLRRAGAAGFALFQLDGDTLDNILPAFKRQHAPDPERGRPASALEDRKP